MNLIDHPNVIKSYCSFVVGHNLWVVMPFMSEGSCLHLMKIAFPDGFEESVIASILKETLKALEYLHRQGHIHRDVKVSSSLFGYCLDYFIIFWLNVSFCRQVIFLFIILVLSSLGTLGSLLACSIEVTGKGLGIHLWEHHAGNFFFLSKISYSSG
jgi:serine/threonine protein kinase